MTNPNDPVYCDARYETEEMAEKSRKDFAGLIGLSKREYFAAMAMFIWKVHAEGSSRHELIAQDCVLQADALIAELSK